MNNVEPLLRRLYRLKEHDGYICKDDDGRFYTVDELINKGKIIQVVPKEEIEKYIKTLMN
jgi:hypothetical protein